MSQTPYEPDGEHTISPHPAGDWHTSPEGESPAAAPPGGAVDGEAAPVAEQVVDTAVDTDGAAVDQGVTVELVRQLDERTSDLQRLQAEYVTY